MIVILFRWSSEASRTTRGTAEELWRELSYTKASRINCKVNNEQEFMKLRGNPKVLTLKA